MLRNRDARDATPTWTLQLYWHTDRKTWHLRAVDHRGRSVGGLRTEAQVALTQADVNVLLRQLRAELEMLLPF